MRVQDGESGSIWLEVLVNCVLFARDGVRIAAVAPLVVSVYYLYASSLEGARFVRRAGTIFGFRVECRCAICRHQ